jgi:hypothetical protein
LIVEGQSLPKASRGFSELGPGPDSESGTVPTPKTPLSLMHLFPRVMYVYLTSDNLVKPKLVYVLKHDNRVTVQPDRRDRESGTGLSKITEYCTSSSLTSTNIGTVPHIRRLPQISRSFLNSRPVI